MFAGGRIGLIDQQGHLCDGRLIRATLSHLMMTLREVRPLFALCRMFAFLWVRACLTQAYSVLPLFIKFATQYDIHHHRQRAAWIQLFAVQYIQTFKVEPFTLLQALQSHQVVLSKSAQVRRHPSCTHEHLTNDRADLLAFHLTSSSPALARDRL